VKGFSFKVQAEKGMPMRVRSEKGFSAAELLVGIAIIGIMAAIVVPWWLSYWPSATVQGAARDLQAGLTQAKMRAITTRQDICVQVAAGGYRFLQGGCGGGAWIGAGTAGNGWFSAPENVTFSSPASPVFTRFGTASNGPVVLRVTGPQNRTQTVTVLATGSVRIP
jgi:type II secretion system protein H